MPFSFRTNRFLWSTALLVTAMWICVQADSLLAQPPGTSSSPEAKNATEKNQSVGPDQAEIDQADHDHEGHDHEGHDHAGHDHATPGKANPTAPNEVESESERFKKLIDEAMAERPELREVFEEQTLTFKQESEKLAKLMAEMRGTYLRYRNRSVRTNEARKKYREQKRAVEVQMDATYDAAFQLMVTAPEPTATRYVMRVLQYRLENDIYDESTLDGAGVLIDMGYRNLIYFIIASRCAIAEGDFDLARRLYERIEPDKLDGYDKLDMFMSQSVDMFEIEYKEEMKFIERDKEKELPLVRFETSIGTFEAELFINDCPSTVSHFIGLVESGFYDNLDFTQVVEGILALTGDPIGDGKGNCNKFLKDENQNSESSRHGLRGSLIMAKIPLEEGKFIPNSASSQFAILFLPKPMIGNTQTIFGRVTKGMDVASRVRRVDPSKEEEGGEKNKIVVPNDQILSATMIRRPETLPTPDYFFEGDE